jgi:anaerobic selenocysteine-containing dehydrogenase
MRRSPIHPRRSRATWSARRWPRAALSQRSIGRAKSNSPTAAKTEVATSWNLYQVHLKDYDLDSVSEITSAPKELIERLAKDIATTTPTSIHQGEGINHWFHATEANRAAYLPLMLTGNIGKPGAGCHGWAGNYKAALFQGSKLTGPGFKGWVMEDPFEQNLDPKAHGRESTRTPTRRTKNRRIGITATARSSSTRPRKAAKFSPARRTCHRRPRRSSRRTST